jgi:hypothetical protein
VNARVVGGKKKCFKRAGGGTFELRDSPDPVFRNLLIPGLWDSKEIC